MTSCKRQIWKTRQCIFNVLCDKCNTVQCKCSGTNFSLLLSSNSAINNFSSQYQSNFPDNHQLIPNDVDDGSISNDSLGISVYDNSTLCDSSQVEFTAYQEDTCEMSTNDISNYDISTDISTNLSSNSTSVSDTLFNLSSLKCASLNVCGLKRRLYYPEFCELVNCYDLFCVCETKLDKYDIIDLPGYTFISQSRKQKFIRKSGGLGVFVRNELSSYITQVGL